MKRAILKLCCVFIITIFCLAPLSAIDLTKDNSDMNKTEIMNDTVDRTINITNESKNIRDITNNSTTNVIDNISNNCNSEINKVNTTDQNLHNEENETKMLGETANLRVVFDDPKENRDINVEIYANEKLKGYSVGLSFFNKKWTPEKGYYTTRVTIEGNCTKYVIHEKFPLGEYIGWCRWGGKAIYEPDDIPAEDYEFEFNVTKLNPDLAVEAKNIISKGDNLSVVIRANETINSDVTYKLNDDTETVHLVNGVGIATIDCHNLSVGHYQICTCFDGDDLFRKDTVLTDFKVMDNPKLRIHVDDSLHWDDKLHVVVDADKEFNGNVTITLNNRVWFRPIEVVNGHGEGYYSGGDYPGNYTAMAKTNETDLFRADNCSTTYEVKDI